MAHMKRSHKYRTKVNVCVQIPGRGESDDDSDDERDDLLILAHYNEGGVYYRVFPYREGDKVVEIDFSEKITCANLIEHVRRALARMWRSVKHGRLLTNNPGDSSKFSLVCDHTVSDVLHSTSKLRPGDKAVYPSILYYQTIKQCIEIELFAVDEGAIDTLQLCLDENDADRMVNEMSDNPLRLQIPARQLPNLLVYILHHLRHLEEYELDPSQVARQVSRGSPTDSTMAPSEDMYPTQIANASMEERARNSLASNILRRSVDLKEFKSAKDWLDVEEKAAKYLSSGVQKIFHVYKVVSGKFRIKWPRKEP
ncbi:hypothetical protein EB796_020111 [Bugula neritina]|uniref:Uncharacterized protein n=1 Tax=Bugula neritina TaxID=10212 RepID=A0A7J7J5Y8_BUGNE|nr:hypothetical protein EB796_020111 [Bugula neritina]